MEKVRIIVNVIKSYVIGKILNYFSKSTGHGTCPHVLLYNQMEGVFEHGAYYIKNSK